MIDWSKPIEWSDGSPAIVLELVETDPQNYCVIVKLPDSLSRTNFPDLYRQNLHRTQADVCYKTGKLLDFSRGTISTFDGYARVRNKL